MFKYKIHAMDTTLASQQTVSLPATGKRGYPVWPVSVQLRDFDHVGECRILILLILFYGGFECGCEDDADMIRNRQMDVRADFPPRVLSPSALQQKVLMLLSFV